MFESLTEKLNRTFKDLRGHGKLTEKNIEDALKEVRLANEISDETAVGHAIYRLRGSHLADMPAIQDRQSVRDRQGFLLIVCNIDGRQAHTLANPPDFTSHLKA